MLLFVQISSHIFLIFPIHCYLPSRSSRLNVASSFVECPAAAAVGQSQSHQPFQSVQILFSLQKSILNSHCRCSFFFVQIFPAALDWISSIQNQYPMVSTSDVIATSTIPTFRMNTLVLTGSATITANKLNGKNYSS